MDFTAISVVVVTSIWLMIPAYVPNPSAVLLGGGTPVDFGRTMRGGRRILGDGKTYKGTIMGGLVGVVAGMILHGISPFIGAPSFGEFPELVLVLIGMSYGSLLGDMAASFFKRRFGLDRGASLPIVDQFDFLAGAWLITYLMAPAWFASNFTLPVIISAIIITPILHVGVNVIGYKIGKKDVSW